MSRQRRVAVKLELEWPLKRHATLFAGSQQYAREAGWKSIIDEFVEHTLPARRTAALPYDGVIARATSELAERCSKLGLPLVNVWASSPVRDQVPGVFPDFEAAGRLRAEHLLARGFRNFAALVSRTNRGHQIELAAFRHVVEAAGFSCTTGVVPLRQRTYAQWRTLESVVTDWTRQLRPPVGVFVGADHLGRVVAQLCDERGWRVPRDVAIVTGGNEETICENPRPSLTSVEMGYERVGYEAARLLDRLMTDGMSTKRTAADDRPAHVLLPPVGLVLRESTDFHSVDEPTVSRALEFVAANSHRAIGPKDVARALTIELRTLQRRFEKHLGRSIVEEIRRVRLERAQRELAFSDRSIGAIAKAVGFEDPMRMTATFRRELDMTPTEYRRQRRATSGRVARRDDPS